MPHYVSVGAVPRKRHTLAHHEGRRLHEELIGTEGFSGASALLYHLRSPSAIVCAEPVACGDGAHLSPDHPLVPRHLRTSELPAGGDAVTGRTVLLGNSDVRLAWVAATGSSPLYRDAVGDQLVYVQSGSGRLETSFGALAAGPGDYLVVPAGVTHRWVVVAAPLELLCLEAAGHVAVPAKYVSERGQMLEGAPFCERDLRVPESPLVEEGQDVDVLVRGAGGLTRLVHRHHPFDVVGWDGWLYPYALSIHDFEPLVGSLHQPPPVHQTFAGPGFVVCSFVPRPFDFHPEAVKVPYHHSNVDSDEVIFYSAGSFMSRAGAGIGPGSISYHPPGFVHGPQPGSVEASMERARTEETAVMVDTFRPLLASEAARRISDPRYPTSWLDG